MDTIELDGNKIASVLHNQKKSVYSIVVILFSDQGRDINRYS
jgi:hypothetical protein